MIITTTFIECSTKCQHAARALNGFHTVDMMTINIPKSWRNFPPLFPKSAWMTNQRPAWIFLEVLEGSIRAPAQPNRQVKTSLLHVSCPEHVGRALAADQLRQAHARKLLLIEINCPAWNQSRLLCTGQKGPQSSTAFVFLLKPQELLKKVHRLLTLSDFRPGRKKERKKASKQASKLVSNSH